MQVRRSLGPVFFICSTVSLYILADDEYLIEPTDLASIQKQNKSGHNIQDSYINIVNLNSRLHIYTQNYNGIRALDSNCRLPSHHWYDRGNSARTKGQCSRATSRAKDQPHNKVAWRTQLQTQI